MAELAGYWQHLIMGLVIAAAGLDLLRQRLAYRRSA